MIPARSILRSLAGSTVVLGLVALGAMSLAEPRADAERGRALFSAKHCNRCHVAGGGTGFGPGLEELRRPQGSLQLVGRLWNHVPAMWATVVQEDLKWPEITAGEMADLMAYLNADAARDAAPDPGKGRVVLMRKGCLKCHSLRREGGGVQPDLALRRSDYDSPPAWAATMWTHTPRMVRASSRFHVPYPRFSGDEMSNLLGFLRQAAAGVPEGQPSPTSGPR